VLGVGIRQKAMPYQLPYFKALYQQLSQRGTISFQITFFGSISSPQHIIANFTLRNNPQSKNKMSMFRFAKEENM
jgi:hypothetical protein